MRVLIILFFSFIYTTAQSQLITNVTWTEESSLPASEIIYYSPERTLVWGNFLGTPQEGGRAAAVTVSGFGYKAGLKTKNTTGELNISVYCYFSKSKSWVKPGKTIPYILTHEQHHFDISYIAARVFAQKLKDAGFTTANYNVLLPRIYNECCDLMNKLQDDYDAQTKNGQLKDMQEKWNNFVDEKISVITK